MTVTRCNICYIFPVWHVFQEMVFFVLNYSEPPCSATPPWPHLGLLPIPSPNKGGGMGMGLANPSLRKPTCEKERNIEKNNNVQHDMQHTIYYNSRHFSYTYFRRPIFVKLFLLILTNIRINFSYTLIFPN